MERIAFIAKTNINTDGRILNEVKILQEWNKEIGIDLIIFPDRNVTISFDDKFILYFGY